MSIGVDAAALGMSNAVVAHTHDVNSGYWNPAGLTHLEDHQIALMHDYFSQAILNNTAVIPEAMEAVKTLRVLDALAKSARESRVIHL